MTRASDQFRAQDAAPAISIVAPMYNEAGGAAALIAEIAAALDGEAFEIIAVDDGSTDETAMALQAAKAATPQLRVLRHRYNAGQSRALRTGALAARGPVIATLDGDGQNDPADLPALLAAFRAGGAALGMVGGERRNRRDTAAKRIASRAANAIRRAVLNDGAADTGCGLKVMRRDAFLALPYFDHFHRYIPALMGREGYQVEFLPVGHRARAHGRSKYTNIGRALVAIRDLAGVAWLMSRRRDPGPIEEIGD